MGHRDSGAASDKPAAVFPPQGAALARDADVVAYAEVAEDHAAELLAAVDGFGLPAAAVGPVDVLRVGRSRHGVVVGDGIDLDVDSLGLARDTAGTRERVLFHNHAAAPFVRVFALVGTSIERVFLFVKRTWCEGCVGVSGRGGWGKKCPR